MQYTERQNNLEGNSNGQNNLGDCYRNGIGTTKDEEKAFQWYMKSAEGGNCSGQNNLGDCYRNGIGTTTDEEKAFQWFMKSAEGGNTNGQNNLGDCYRNGIGTTKDEEKAFQWYLKSAEGANSSGQNNLGDCYRNGIGTTKDEEKAFQWYLKSAEGANSSGQNNLGDCYRNGIGTTKDEEKAFQWFMKSAEGGNTNGQNNLGYCYRNGIGTTKDEEKAFQWYLKSAEGANSSGQNNLGDCYRNGIGTTKDEEKAFQWFMKSAEGGNTNGQNNLGDCYGNGIGTTKDEEKAFQWYFKSAEGGVKYVQSSVDYLYRNEIGISKIKKNKNNLMQDDDIEVAVNHFNNFCCICWKENSCSKICIYYFQNFGLCHDCGNLNRYKNICLNCKLIEISYLSKWSSGNYEIDKIIHMSQLDENAREWEIWRWMDYSKFKNIEYLAEGAFSRIWKAEWIDMPEELFGFYNSDQVALKKFKNSQQISSEFLKELTVNFHCRDRYVLPVLGITYDLKTKEFAIVLRYMKNGNLLEFLQQNKKLPWKERVWEWEIWRWMDYSKFKNIEYLAEGAFSRIWKAEWIDMPEELFGFYNSDQVALKKFKNSQQISSEFLKELTVNFHCRDRYVLPVLGITYDLKTKEFAIVLRYMKNGNLLEFLQQNKKLPWKERVWLLNSFIRGLKTIHNKGFIHRDLHPGNLMITESYNNAKFIRLGDLGFCRSVNEILSSGTYGILPYIAPEVMNNNKYTQASDIYSVGIIMWVISTGKIPFEGELYDPKLAISIFYGCRPKIHKGTPQCYVDLMEKCWHNNPTERPNAKMIFNTLEEWINDISYYEKSENALMFLNADQEMQNVDSELSYNETTLSKTHLISQPLMRHSLAIHESFSKFDINKYTGLDD
ncbi:hypothetical protein Glove_139g258 [Diversispora epigaea]|uniref:Protein kinase domain-containing protein n=1 Tax=Diversispora epigaea TaxID=1348612 RepID=A0A397J4F3_9GLOM|nr:hypothetical protein Glove_139g258 [Diversispora epigaea]